jgi:hypothetical protein
MTYVNQKLIEEFNSLKEEQNKATTTDELLIINHKLDAVFKLLRRFIIQADQLRWHRH